MSDSVGTFETHLLAIQQADMGKGNGKRGRRSLCVCNFCFQRPPEEEGKNESIYLLNIFSHDETISTLYMGPAQPNLAILLKLYRNESAPPIGRRPLPQLSSFIEVVRVPV